MIRAGAKLSRNESNPGLTIEEWLDQVGQSEELKRAFWEPLAIAIMNEHISRASARVFTHSLRLAFLRKHEHAALAIPTVGLSQLYVNASSRYITDRGGSIRTHSDVSALGFEGNRVRGVRLRDGTMLHGSAIILSVPHFRIADFFHEGLFELPDVHQIRSTPIVSIHLWFDHNFMTHEVVGVIDRRIQWVFNKRTVHGNSDGHVSCVISGADAFVDLPNERLVNIAREDLQSVYPNALSAPRHAVVIREKRATFSCSPDSDPIRPTYTTQVQNLFVAGDWTKTDLPATIEGAVLSGTACAILAKSVTRPC